MRGPPARDQKLAPTQGAAPDGQLSLLPVLPVISLPRRGAPPGGLGARMYRRGGSLPWGRRSQRKTRRPKRLTGASPGKRRATTRRRPLAVIGALVAPARRVLGRLGGRQGRASPRYRLEPPVWPRSVAVEPGTAAGSEHAGAKLLVLGAAAPSGCIRGGFLPRCCTSLRRVHPVGRILGLRRLDGRPGAGFRAEPPGSACPACPACRPRPPRPPAGPAGPLARPALATPPSPPGPALPPVARAGRLRPAPPLPEEESPPNRCTL
jgi:hypothetical protein